MSIAPDQLGDIYRQINDRFLSHPLISVTPTQGDPPDQYNITYTISGLTQAENGEITEASEHVVELSIPFGFPHFPPSCRPKTVIFHPDFDPGAICIGDYWEQNPSIIDLILQIGQMINGEFYSSQNAFNEKAANWYDQHSEKLPLNQISWDKSDPEQIITDSLEDIELDTLDVEDLSFDFDDPLSSENTNHENSLAELFPTVEMQLDGEDDLEISSLHDIQSRKEFFTLKKELEGQTEFSSELQVLLDDAEDIIGEGEALYKEAKDLEKRGNASEALKKYRKVAQTISDYPAIHADIKRLEQTLDLVEDLIPSEGLATFIEPEGIDTAEPLRQQEKSPPKPAEKKQPLQKTAKPKLYINKVYIIAPVLALILGLCAYYALSFYAKQNLNNAQANLTSCSQAIAANEFLKAKQLCENGLESIGSIWFFHKEKANEVKSLIEESLKSDELTQGLAGNVLVDGKYVSAKAAKLLQALKKTTENAEGLYYKGKYPEASKAFMAAAGIAEKVDKNDKDLIEKLENKSKLSGFKQAQSEAKSHIKENNWTLAIESIIESQNRLQELPTDSHEKYGNELENLLQLSHFEMAFAEGEDAISRGDWDASTRALNIALDYALKVPGIDKIRLDSIENSLTRADLYKTLEKGNKAFAVGDWNTAIEAYKKANTKLIQSNNSTNDAATSEVKKKKLSKIILQASIIRDKQSIQSMLDNDELHGARNTYRNLLTLIKSSDLSGENEFTKIKADIRTHIDELDKKIYISDKTKYLQENYQTLFSKNYENAIEENLSSPVIELIKDSSEALIFRLQCSEKRRGRPLTLVMFYAFNKSTGKWALSVGN